MKIMKVLCLVLAVFFAGSQSLVAQGWVWPGADAWEKAKKRAVDGFASIKKNLSGDYVTPILFIGGLGLAAGGVWGVKKWYDSYQTVTDPVVVAKEVIEIAKKYSEDFGGGRMDAYAGQLAPDGEAMKKVRKDLEERWTENEKKNKEELEKLGSTSTLDAQIEAYKKLFLPTIRLAFQYSFILYCLEMEKNKGWKATEEDVTLYGKLSKSGYDIGMKLVDARTEKCKKQIEELKKALEKKDLSEDLKGVYEEKLWWYGRLKNNVKDNKNELEGWEEQVKSGNWSPSGTGEPVHISYGEKSILKCEEKINAVTVESVKKAQKMVDDIIKVADGYMRTGEQGPELKKLSDALWNNDSAAHAIRDMFDKKADEAKGRLDDAKKQSGGELEPKIVAYKNALLPTLKDLFLYYYIVKIAELNRNQPLLQDDLGILQYLTIYAKDIAKELAGARRSKIEKEDVKKKLLAGELSELEKLLLKSEEKLTNVDELSYSNSFQPAPSAMVAAEERIQELEKKIEKK